MFSHIWRIGLANGIVHYIAQHEDVTLDECIAHVDETTKRAKNPQARVRELVTLACDFGLVLRNEDGLDLSPSGREFVQRSTEQWEINEAQAAILRECFRNGVATTPRLTALCKLLELVANKKEARRSDLGEDFARLVGKRWKSSATRASTINMALNYLHDLGVIAKEKGLVRMTPAGEDLLATLRSRDGRASGSGSEGGWVEQRPDSQHSLDQLRRRLVTFRRSTDRDAHVTKRDGDRYLRPYVLVIYGNCCALCDISVPRLLRVSHAKAWAWTKNPNERLDPANTILLCVMHDALFDQGLIGFTDTMAVIRSPGLDETISSSLRPFVEDLTFRRPLQDPPNKKYIGEHRRRHGLGNQPSESAKVAASRSE